MIQHQLDLETAQTARLVCGERDSHLRRIEKGLGIEVLVRGTHLTLRGPSRRVERGVVLFQELQSLANRGSPVGEGEVDGLLRLCAQEDGAAPKFDEPSIPRLRRHVMPRTPRQREYVEAIRTAPVVFGVGPAGTGKTYLAMAMAASALLGGQVNRIVLTRPAVEAGEKLGYLPGSMMEKVNPYLRPLYDALHDMMDVEKAGRLIETGVIEVAPLAFMRGRTLNESFVILDEAQNTTPAQMKMFLTRLGNRSQTVVMGDITQIDLPPAQRSGLIDAVHVLEGVEGVRFIHFDRSDVVRHPLVEAIVAAYEKAGGEESP
ncbi:MAG: PhoH family protein [Bdellovibrionota bacterium]